MEHHIAMQSYIDYTWSLTLSLLIFQNTAKFGRNLMRYMSVQHILKFISANVSWNFVTETCKQRPETTRRRLCCEKLGTSNDVKGFAIGSFLERIVVERANDDLCLKNVENAGLISQSISSEFSLKITTKLAIFYQLLFRRSLFRKFPGNWPIFLGICP